MRPVLSSEKLADAHDYVPTLPLPAQYELRGRLGEGGFGVVHEAWDSKLRRGVAVKFTKPEHTETSLMREARMGASLHHSAFVKVYAIEQAGEHQAIIMELVRGRTLKDVIAGGPVDTATASDWVTKIAEAMREAHASGMVHGDLKPSNLMVEPGGNVRILDFGLAQRPDMLMTTSFHDDIPQGTIAYMAPERMLGARCDAQSDVFALGVILYELVCGARPFAHLQGLALAAAQMQCNPDQWAYTHSLDASLRSLIRDMTAREPRQRLAGMEAVVARLRHLGTTADTADPFATFVTAATRASASSGHAVPDTGRKPRHKRYAYAAAATLAIAVLAGAAWHVAGRPGVTMADVLVPYSEAREMQQGLVELKFYDRPNGLAQAIERFDRILEHNPGNGAAAAGLSLAYSLRYMSDTHDENWLQKAAAGAQQSIRLDNQLALGHTATAWVLLNQGRHDQALKEVGAAIHLDPRSYFAWYGKVQILRHARRFDDALAALAQARRQFPAERAFLDELGTVRYAQGAYAEAEAAFRQSIALEPDTVAAYAGLNAALLRQNRMDEGLAVLQQGLQVRPSAKLYGNLGTALFLNGDYVGAADAFQNAVSPTRGAPGDYLNWANLGDALLWIPGGQGKARDAYAKARELLAPQLQRSPGNATLVYRMGMYCARTGDRAQAATLMALALALAPTSADVQFYAGLAYELIGHRRQAIDAILRARRLGYPSKFIDAEPDLIALRRDPTYVAE